MRTGFCVLALCVPLLASCVTTGTQGPGPRARYYNPIRAPEPAPAPKPQMAPAAADRAAGEPAPAPAEPPVGAGVGGPPAASPEPTAAKPEPAMPAPKPVPMAKAPPPKPAKASLPAPPVRTAIKPTAKPAAAPPVPHKAAPPEPAAPKAAAEAVAPKTVALAAPATGTPKSAPESPAVERPEPPPQVALVEPPSGNRVKVTFEALPIAIGSNWTLERGLDPVSKRDRCYLVSATGRIDDGQGGTPITLFLTQDSLRVATRSHIDTSYTGTGLQVDDQPPLPLGEVFKLSSVVFSNHAEQIHQRFAHGREARIILGFWPTWPATHTYDATFPLAGYDRALAALRECDAL